LKASVTMPAPLTVLIPTLNAADSLGPTLASMFDGVQDGLIAELIFADGGSTDGTAAIADDIGATLITSAPGRGTQLATAAKTLKTPWLMVIHADTVLSQDWTRPVRDHINTSQNAAYFRLAFDSTKPAARRTAAWANLRSKLFQLPYGDQGLLLPTALYKNVGGYADIPLMEDVKIVRALRGKLTQLDATATTSAAKYDAEGYLKRGSKNLLTLSKYLMGVSPETLVKRY
jgi:rSAM/selenodomain-associated transferase 2